MDAPTNPDEVTTDEIDEIDDKYSDVDPDDVAENAVDYFQGKPETESDKAERESDEEAR